VNANTDVDDITARLRAEDRRLRRRTLWLSLVPVAVGLVVLGGAWWAVHELETQRTELTAHVGRLAGERTRLAARIGEQEASIGELESRKAALERDIAAHQSLLDQATMRLPAPERERLGELQQGLDLAQVGNTAAAIRRYDRAIAEAPTPVGSALPYRLRGEAQYAAGDAAAARDSLAEAVRLDPKDAQARYSLALALWAQGDTDRALAEVQRAFADPAVQSRALQDPAFRPVRAELDARAGQASGRSADEKAFIDEGLQAARRGEFLQAVQAYDKALALHPGNARVLNWKGYALLRATDYAGAVQALAKATGADPSLAEAHYNLALALWRLERRDEALASLRRAYDADPKFKALAERDPQSRALRAAL
jgi:tetratricopeptide (TPR) repeat protein